MAVLIITRDKGWTDKLRKYKIIIDGNEFAEIKESETLELNLDAGQHEIYCKIDWCGSNKINFNINHAETKRFAITSSLRGAKFLLLPLYITIFRFKYLRMEEI